ncbi:MAG: N-acetylmuramoyl-L-alanine amidase, partial [Thermoactinospora sp.]|nr:N-acetylmuramoyl-L-alanine amidase [Thermoactinospora sp.]
MRVYLAGPVVLAALAALSGACGGGSAHNTQGAAMRSPASPSPTQEQRALAGKTVVIDPGHNGGNASHPEEINRPVDIITGTKPCNTT